MHKSRIWPVGHRLPTTEIDSDSFTWAYYKTIIKKTDNNYLELLELEII